MLNCHNNKNYAYLLSRTQFVCDKKRFSKSPENLINSINCLINDNKYIHTHIYVYMYMGKVYTVAVRKVKIAKWFTKLSRLCVSNTITRQQ